MVATSRPSIWYHSDMKNAFVMMPFSVKESEQPQYQDSNHWNEVYHGLIVPAAKLANVTCIRDDQDLGSRIISDDMLRKIEECDIAICDLSSHNPNVFLELGWALRADRAYVLLQDDLTRYTFDLNQQFTFSYDHRLQPTVLGRDVQKLGEVIKRTLEDSDRRYSVVQRLSVSMDAIEASQSGDLQVQLLLQLRDQIRSIQRTGSDTQRLPRAFEWPKLLSRVQSVATEVAFVVEQDPEVVRHREKMQRVLERLRAFEDIQIQCTIFNSDREIVYHDWEHMIGSTGHRDINDEDVFAKIEGPSGVLGWVDESTNDPRLLSAGTLRCNIGYYFEVGEFIVLVEAHEIL